MPPYISGKSKGFLVFAGVVMLEALIFGLLQFYYYYRSDLNFNIDKVLGILAWE